MGILEDKRRARIFYRYLSRVYDRINPFIWTEEMRNDAIDLLDIEDSDRILDVGCGTGFGTTGLLKMSDRVVGIDQSPEQLARARRKLGHTPARFLLGDAERLPFRDHSYDIVWSSGSIEYWPRPVETLREMQRVCRPGGQILVVGPNAPKSRILRAIADGIMLFYSEEEADTMFHRAGFESFEHHLMGPSYRPKIAITTIARVPETIPE